MLFRKEERASHPCTATSIVKIMKFAIFGNTYQASKSAHAANLLHLLARRGAQLLISKEFHQFITRKLGIDVPQSTLFEGNNFDADMAISIGGDGTFLQAAGRVGGKNIPILGINTGRLGFLADISPDEMEQTFDEIYSHRYRIEERSVLQVRCGGKPLFPEPFALNEIAVLKRDSSSMISIHTSVNGAPLNTYQADGLIIATPTGSTAYSLSVGGPIIVPQSKTIALTPVAPHSLNMRPIVICDDWEIGLSVESRSHNFLVAIDGRSQTCEENIRLTIAKAPHTIKVVKRFDHAFFKTLRAKMMWGADVR